MASIGETKKLVAGVAKQMGQLGARLDKAKGNFENAKKHADKVLAGSATSIEAEVSGKMQKAALGIVCVTCTGTITQIER